MKNNLFKVVLGVLLIVSIFSMSTAHTFAANNKTINFGYVQWPGVTIKTHVVKKIAEYLGYDAKMTAGMQQVIFKGMETGDIDVFLGNWMPTMKVNFDKYRDKGIVKNVRTNLLDVVYRTAVPKYVWEAGVKSMADLHKYADKFDNKIYGIEPGNDGNIVIQDAIKNNTYNLGDWELMASSTAGMLGAVNGATKKKEWIAFNGWKPHYMNLVYDIKYLKDPEGIWGSGEKVLTVIRDGFQNENPNFYKLLKQFKVTSPIQDKWIYEYKQKERDPEKVAEEWISNNTGIVNQWVYGVKSVDGKMARKVIAQKVKAK